MVWYQGAFLTLVNISCPICIVISPQDIHKSRVQSVGFHCRSHSAGVVTVGVVSNWIQFTHISLSVVAQISVTCCRVGVGIFSISHDIGLKMSIMLWLQKQ